MVVGLGVNNNLATCIAVRPYDNDICNMADPGSLLNSGILWV